MSKQDDKNSEYSGTEFLSEGETSLRNYNNQIVRKFRNAIFPSVVDANARILDFGAGIGTLALIWRERYGISPYCSEIDGNQLKVLNQLGFVSTDNISNLGEMDAIYTSNVLEHIEKDEEIIRELAYKLRQGGKLVIYVPALMILFSDLDRSVGHYRRYERKDLIEKVKKSGLIIKKCEYADSIGVPASLALKILGYRSKANLGGGLSLRIYDNFILPISLFLDFLGFKYFLGKNLFLVAEKI